MLTVIMLVYNNEERAKYAIEHIRMYHGLEEIQLVVIDNGSKDGFDAWAGAQEDFAYVYMDEGHSPEGKVLNEVIEALAIDTDILVLNGNMLVLPDTLPKMADMLYKEEKIGAVGGVSNLFSGAQYQRDADVYEAAVRLGKTLREDTPHFAAGLDFQGIMLKAEAREKAGGFDEELTGLYYVMSDYLLRLTSMDYRLAIHPGAVFFGIGESDEERSAENASKMETKWGMHYFNHVYNGNLIQKIEEKGDGKFRVLEVGCDCGATLLEIKQRYPGAEVYGTDINASAVRIASHFAQTSVGNIEERKLPYPEGYFRYIIFGDVLEHLRNPLEAVIYCKTLLCEGGAIIASIPNLMHISVTDDLLRGNFTYRETGLLDKTHIHLFTYNEIIRMFKQAGFENIQTGYVKTPLSEREREIVKSLRTIYPDTPEYMFETFQYVVKVF